MNASRGTIKLHTQSMGYGEREGTGSNRASVAEAPIGQRETAWQLVVVDPFNSPYKPGDLRPIAPVPGGLGAVAGIGVPAVKLKPSHSCKALWTRLRFLLARPERD